MGLLWNDAASVYSNLRDNFTTLVNWINTETCHGE